MVGDGGRSTTIRVYLDDSSKYSVCVVMVNNLLLLVNIKK